MASVRGGMGGIGGGCPGSTNANNGSLRQAAFPAGEAAGFTGSSYQVPGVGFLSRSFAFLNALWVS
jgi:hypothetical protein